MCSIINGFRATETTSFQVTGYTRLTAGGYRNEVHRYELKLKLAFKRYIQFPNMNTDRSLNKPYINDVSL